MADQPHGPQHPGAQASQHLGAQASRHLGAQALSPQQLDAAAAPMSQPLETDGPAAPVRMRGPVMARLAVDRDQITWGLPPEMTAGVLPANSRRVMAKRVATGLRQLLFPKGSRRDKFWAYRVRPIMLGAFGMSGRRALPPARVVTLSSPATQFFGPGETIRSVLVLKLDHIGDMLLAMPALGELRRHFREASLTLMCAPWNVGIARKLDLFDRIIPIEFFPGRADSARRPVFDPEVIEALALPMFDVAIDLRIDEDTRGVLNHISARFKAGYFSRRMPSDMALVLPRETLNPAEQMDILHHQRTLMMKLVSTVIAYLDPLHDTFQMLARVTAEHEAEMRALVAGMTRPLIAVNTSSGREIKNWPLENFIQLCRWITGELGGTLLLVGGPGDARNAQTIMRRVGTKNVKNLVGQLSLDRSFALLREVDLYIGNDSGLTHASASSNTPTLAIYSGIDPIAMWLPLGPHVSALKALVPCSPCHLTHITDCPNGHACIRAISVNTVKLTVQRMLSERRPEGPATRIDEAAE